MDPLFEYFYAGFHKVCGGKVLELFQPNELQAMVIGNTNYDWTDLEKVSIYLPLSLPFTNVVGRNCCSSGRMVQTFVFPLQSTEYKGEYWKDHPTIKLFWEVFHNLPLEKKKQFLCKCPFYKRKYTYCRSLFAKGSL